MKMFQFSKRSESSLTSGDSSDRAPRSSFSFKFASTPPNSNQRSSGFLSNFNQRSSEPQTAPAPFASSRFSLKSLSTFNSAPGKNRFFVAGKSADATQSDFENPAHVPTNQPQHEGSLISKPPAQLTAFGTRKRILAENSDCSKDSNSRPLKRILARPNPAAEKADMSEETVPRVPRTVMEGPGGSSPPPNRPTLEGEDSTLDGQDSASPLPPQEELSTQNLASATNSTPPTQQPNPAESTSSSCGLKVAASPARQGRARPTTPLPSGKAAFQANRRASTQQRSVISLRSQSASRQTSQDLPVPSCTRNEPQPPPSLDSLAPPQTRNLIMSEPSVHDATPGPGAAAPLPVLDERLNREAAQFDSAEQHILSFATTALSAVATRTEDLQNLMMELVLLQNDVLLLHDPRLESEMASLFAEMSAECPDEEMQEAG